jgi:BCD family chlorophyll transporter-like MFS transporter
VLEALLFLGAAQLAAGVEPQPRPAAAADDGIRLHALAQPVAQRAMP